MQKQCLTILLFSLFLLPACQSMRSPSMSGNPVKMSSDTLCYRYATAKTGEAIAAEVARRNLDCNAMIANDPLYTGGR